MRNKDYSLVVLHHEEVFATREEAIKYLTGWYKPNSLDAEPVIVKYGDANNPDVILAFGTSDTKPGSFYAIDMTQAVERIDTVEEEVNGSKEELDYVAEVLDGVVKATGLILDENKIEDKVSYQPDSRDNVIGTAITIAEAIDLLSKYTQKGFEDNKFTVEDTKSVKLIYSVNPDGGMVLKARVKISTDGDSDELNFNNNIIGIKSDGIYAASNLAYDDVRHQLIFTTSGYKNGRFQDDAIVQKVDLGEHTRLVADNEDRTVKLIITENENTNITKLSADLQIADRENNILKVSDGKAYVEGLAKNIKYGETTVAAALTNHKNSIRELTTSVEGAAKSAHIEGGQTDTLETVVSTLSDGGAKITGNVRLGSANSIVVRNGGLEADVSVDVDTTTNKLIVRVGNQTIEKILPGVELFESADYNDANEELNITFKTGNTLTIPIHGIIHTWDVNNSESSPVVLTKTVVTGGVDKLSANIKLRSTDNLIGVENGKLYVSEQGINNKVSAETTRATEAENAIRTSVETLSNNVQTQFAEVSDRITTVQDNLNEESTRARESENTIRTTAEHADEVALEAKETVNGLNSTVNELSTSLTTLETNVENLEESLTQSILTEKNRAQTAEETIIKRIAHDISDVNAAIASETARATAAEQANANAIATNTSTIEVLNGNEATDGSVKNAIKVSKDYTDEQVAGKANAADVYTKDEIDNKGFLTEHQDISNLATIASVDAVTEVAADNASAIQELSAEVDDMKFITKETDTVRMTMVKETGAETRILSSDVKLKTLSGENANIIKSDANGLYATVTFNYDKATNKITFNDGNGNKVFELNNFGILQEAFYDSENKSIVLVVKKDDESTERITITVADLVNEWSVQNNTNSPIILNKTAGENGDVLSANVSILDNGHNLLVNENGSLFVDSDSNSHLALFGEQATSVQGAINILKDRTDDIEQIKQDIENLEEDNNNIKIAIADYQTDLANQKERITTNENNIAQLRDSEHQLEAQVVVLTEKVNNLESRVNEAYDKATLALSKIEEMGDISSLVNRIENIENILRNLIDFGLYDTNN